jgi:hypothetical protein
MSMGASRYPPPIETERALPTSTSIGNRSVSELRFNARIASRHRGTDEHDGAGASGTASESTPLPPPYNVRINVILNDPREFLFKGRSDLDQN